MEGPAQPVNDLAELSVCHAHGNRLLALEQQVEFLQKQVEFLLAELSIMKLHQNNPNFAAFATLADDRKPGDFEPVKFQDF
jgi:hypothetical protein